jgi:parvulin-like peptidyl-prolyl isomerase
MIKQLKAIQKENTQLKLLLLLGTVGTVIFTGCADESKKTARFTDEQMASIPFVDSNNVRPHSRLVLNLGTETITVDEIVTPVMDVIDPNVVLNYDSFAFRVGPVLKDAVVEKVFDALLCIEARKHAPDNIDKMIWIAAKKEINKLQASYDNDYAQVRKAIEEMGMDRKQYEEYLKKQMLKRWYYSSQNLLDDRMISHRDMLERYQAMMRDGFEFKGLLKKEDVKVDGIIQFRLIDIITGELSADEINADKLETPEDAALRKGRMLAEMINNGFDFGELAKEHSHYRAAEGGLWTPVLEHSPLVGPYAVVQRQAKKMEIGQVAGPVVSGGHVFVIKLEKKQIGRVTPFVELQKRIELDINLERRKARFDKLKIKLLNRTNPADFNPFVNVCIETAWQRFNNMQANR